MPVHHSLAWQRRQAFWNAADDTFDVVIIGGGVQGACLFDRLVREGYRVLIVDRGDFACGTSQASAMLVWGGLLYLKQFDLPEVIRLCEARDRLIGQHGRGVDRRHVSYLFGDPVHRPRWVIRLALQLYWLSALGRRAVPVWSAPLRERDFLRDSSVRNHVRFEEGGLRSSDAMFVFDWIDRGSAAPNGVAMNYCEATAGRYDTPARHWQLDLTGTLEPRARSVTARWIVNAAGVWADAVNDRFGIESPWQQLLAKGASITIDRLPGHHDTLVFDGRGKQEGLSLVPWGRVSLWGSTETIVDRPDTGWRVDSDDVTFLLDSLNRHLVRPHGPNDIVALRCGVRALVVKRGQAAGDPLMLSKRSRVWRDPDRPWISIYGGKLTGCEQVASRATSLLRDAGLASRSTVPTSGDDLLATPAPPIDRVADIDVPPARWCRDHQMCWTLEDYLRRRTNLAQWLPRGGLGRNDEHREKLLQVAEVFVETTGRPATEQLRAYSERIKREYDRVLGRHPMVETTYA